MRFDPKKVVKHESLDEVLSEIYTPEQVTEIDVAAEKRSNIRRTLSDQVAKALMAYMAKENIGFNELERRLPMSSATISKLLKGEANITLETIASVAMVIDKTPAISWEQKS